VNGGHGLPHNVGRAKSILLARRLFGG
jgi:hypothetical protein